MSKVQLLRSFLKQRLPADDEDEIFELFERTIAEYEEELCRLKEENERQRKLLDAVFNPEVRLHKTDVQQLLVTKVPLEHQGWNCSLDQDGQELYHIKKEEEELWTSEEQQHLHVLEVDATKFANDDMKPQSSQLQHPHIEENRGSDTDGQLFTPRESYLHPHIDNMLSNSSEAETVVSDVDWKDTRESHSPLNCIKNHQVPINYRRCNAGVKPCSHKSGEQIGQRGDLVRHMRIPTEDKPFICSKCGKTFSQNSHLKTHMIIHTQEKPFSCSVCGKKFGLKGNLKIHMTSHTGEKPYSCSECGQRFGLKGNLKIHMISHTGEKPFGCSECGQRFGQKCSLKRHMRIHTREKTFRCSECGEMFDLKGNLKRHLRMHLL